MVTQSEGYCKSIFLTEHQTPSQTHYLAAPAYRQELQHRVVCQMWICAF